MYDLPFMSCITIELYSRNVTNRFVGWLEGSLTVEMSILAPKNN